MKRQDYKKMLSTKAKKNKLIKSSVLMALGTIVIGGGTTTLASTWVANSPESINIVESQNSYTMVEGDTLWAVGIKINVNVETLATINNISLANGEEYHLAIGTVIKWDKSGHLVAQTPNGQQINSAKITDSNKIVPTKPVGEDVGQDIKDNNISDEQIQGGDNDIVKPVDPVKPDPEVPVKPVEPTEPTEPTNPGEVEQRYTVWYTGRDTSEFDIVLGTQVFDTKGEAYDFIDNYADDRLLEGHAAQSYGVSTWSE